MLITHRILLDTTNKQKTLFQKHTGHVQLAWNWGVPEFRRALDTGELGVTTHQRFRPLSNQVKV